MSKIKNRKRKTLIVNKNTILTETKTSSKLNLVSVVLGLIVALGGLVTIYTAFESYNKRDADFNEVFWEYSSIIENIVYGRNIITNIEETKKVYPKITKILTERPLLSYFYNRKEHFLNSSYSCILDSHNYSTLNEALILFNRQMLLLYQIDLAIKNDTDLLDKYDSLNKESITDRIEYCNQLSKLQQPVSMFSIIKLSPSREQK